MTPREAQEVIDQLLQPDKAVLFICPSCLISYHTTFQTEGSWDRACRRCKKTWPAFMQDMEEEVLFLPLCRLDVKNLRAAVQALIVREE